MTDLSSEFKKSVRRIRENLGLSQEELGIKCGMQKAQVSQIEVGKGGVTLETLEKIADALEVDPRTLLSEKEVMKAPASMQDLIHSIRSLTDAVEHINKEKDELQKVVESFPNDFIAIWKTANQVRRDTCIKTLLASGIQPKTKRQDG